MKQVDVQNMDAGLTEAEAQRRLASGQGNTMPVRTTRTYVQIFRENLFNFINIVLFGLGIALVLLHHPTDAAISVGVIMANVLVSIVQEIRAKRILDRIAVLTRPNVTVVRDGVEREIPPDGLVVGDLIAFGAGDQMLVDGRLTDNGAEIHVEMDESPLTGESHLVSKHMGDPIYSGSFCVSGSARYVAERVGAASLANQITRGARQFRRMSTPLQSQINLVIRAVLLVVVYIEVLLVIDSVLNRNGLVQSVQQSVIIASLVPNGLLLSIALAYAIGAVRIIGYGALVQQANAVEALSTVDVLCLDKTGTLTVNRLLLDGIYPVGLSEDELRQILGTMAHSATSRNKTTEALARACPGSPHPTIAEVAFSSERKWSALAFDEAPGGSSLQGWYFLGAPEVLAAHVPSDSTAPLEGLLTQMTSQGLRVLMVAHAPASASATTAGEEPELPEAIEPLGLFSLRDELRPEAQKTLTAFVRAGVQPKIISGDDPRTVTALATQAGLMGGEGDATEGRGVLTGPQLEAMNDDELEAAAEHATIFARVSPHHKERLVEALQRRGHFVAMIGDGVNDVLSLKKAEVGIAMQSGSQASRSVADIVLMNDSFESLLPAVEAGQRIINGMQDILKIFLTRISTIALVIVSAWLIGIFPLSLRHGSMVTLLTVGIPSIALALWARTGPAATEKLVRQLLRFVVPAALTTSLLSLLLFYGRLTLPIVMRTAGLSRTPPGELSDLVTATVPAAQTTLTAFLVTCGVLLILFVDPPARWWAVANPYVGDWRPVALVIGMLTALVAFLLLPPLRAFFSLAQLSALDLLTVAVAGTLWLLIVRTIWRTELMDRFLGVKRETAKSKPTSANV
ncbi:MAG TPA: HAD-IC family P-type ATPase [Ktedonobacterales bacterium]